MRRLHLFEFEDLPWLPAFLRNAATDCLRFLFSLFVGRTDLADRLGSVLEATGERHVIDLCSGSTGALLPLLRSLAASGRPVTATLSDKYPNLEIYRSLAAADPAIDYRSDSIDARQVPRELGGVRTLFAAFHHFEPADAVAILGDAVRDRRGIALFEAAERRPAFLGVLAFMPLAVWAMTPFLRPFSWRRLVFTYIVPLIPFLVLWDGVVSACRTYTLSELQALGDRALETLPVEDRASFRFVTGRSRVRGLPVSVSWMLGWPVETLPDSAEQTLSSVEVPAEPVSSP